jgi:hypothetical protein
MRCILKCLRPSRRLAADIVCHSTEGLSEWAISNRILMNLVETTGRNNGWTVRKGYTRNFLPYSSLQPQPRYFLPYFFSRTAPNHVLYSRHLATWEGAPNSNCWAMQLLWAPCRTLICSRSSRSTITILTELSWFIYASNYSWKSSKQKLDVSLSIHIVFSHLPRK